MTRCRLIVLVVFYLLSASAFAQKVISGRVVDQASGEPLPGTNLYLLNHWETGASTNLNGEFELTLKGDAQLQDTLVFSFVGFAEKMVPLSNWKNGTVQLKMKQNALAEVVVESSSLVAEEFQYEEIGKLKIYTSPAAKADPLLAVNALPSATPSDESANISLRGGSTAQTGVFFNDVPIYDYVKFSQLNGIGVFSIFNTSMVKNVSVFPGNPPLEYGNVSGGMVSVVSDDRVVKANTNNLTISPASFGYFRQQRLSDKVMVSFFGNYQPGGILKLINGDALRGIRSFELFDAGVYLFAQLDDHSLIKVFNYTLSESYQFNFRSPSFNGVFDQARNRNFTTFKYEGRKDRSSWSVNSGYSVSDATFAYSQFETDSEGKDFFLGLNYQYSTSRYIIKAGLSSDNRGSRANGTAPMYGHALDVDHPFITFNADMTTRRVNVGFVYGKYFPTVRMTVGGGLRTNLGLEGDAYVSRQLNVKWDFNTNLSLILGGGRYHQAIRAFDFQRSADQLVSDQVSADLKWVANGTQVSASVFWKKNEGATTISNELTGIELYYEKSIASGLSFDVAATYIDGENLISLDGRPPTSISYFLRGNANWNIVDQWTLGGNLLYREGNVYFPLQGTTFDAGVGEFEPLFSNSGEQLPNYFSVGLSLSNQFALSERMTVIVFASVNNATNHDNVRTYTFNEDYSERSTELFSGRTVYFGGVFRF